MLSVCDICGGFPESVWM